MPTSNPWWSPFITAALLVACRGAATPTAPVPVASPAEAPSEVPGWVVPDGWKAETIRFPLGFAPSIEHRGVEELRFPPRFYEAGHGDYFSYAFVWYLRAPGPADAEALERDLVAYFAGLARAVGGDGRADVEAFETKAELVGDLAGGVTGTVEAFEAFTAQAPVRLHVAAWSAPCTQAGLIALVFVASPILDGPGWKRAHAIGRSFTCP